MHRNRGSFIWCGCARGRKVIEPPGEGGAVGTGKSAPFTGADTEGACEVAFFCLRIGSRAAGDGEFEDKGTAPKGEGTWGLETGSGYFGAVEVVVVSEAGGHVR